MKEVKRQLPEWDKIFSNLVSDKGLVSTVYEELLQLSKNRQHNLNWANDLNTHFSQEDIQIANKHMTQCLTSFVRDVREMQIRTTMRYYFIFTGYL